VVMPGATSAVELAEKAQRLRPGIAVLLTSGYARDLISRQEAFRLAVIAAFAPFYNRKMYEQRSAAAP